jgi:hypothetical protein
MELPNQTLSQFAQELRTDISGLSGVISGLSDRVNITERYIKLSRGIGIGLIISLAFNLALTVGLIYTQHKSNNNIACQAAYNTINNERTRILTDVGADERNAERAASDALYAVFLDPSLSKPANLRTAADQKRLLDKFTAFRKAGLELKTQRALADKARAANPVPPPPSSVCG